MSGVAFGKPGVAPTWCSSDKDFITTSLGASRLWATVGHGIVNEVYWPSTGRPQIRDLSFYLIGSTGWVDLKRIRRYRLSTPGPYLPALTVTHHGEDYQLALDILPDPLRDVLLIRYSLDGPHRLVALLAPHLGCTGQANHAWVEEGEGYARRGDAALCLTADAPLLHLSCGYVGFSDGWQDLNQHGALSYAFTHADAGTVSLSGEAQGRRGVLALGFAETPKGAHTLARAALAESFESLREEFLRGWRSWGDKLKLPRPTEVLGDAGLFCATVLKIHEDRSYPGAVVASLSVPWGNTTDTLGGYHLVWPRDATLGAFALLGAAQITDASRMLGHLMAVQTPEGRWPQNYFPSGESFWTGTQLDEAGFPVLLAAKLRELGAEESPGTAAMVRAAVGFIVRSGPSSDQDRWEENPGINPFTVAVVIAALIAAAPWLTPDERTYAAAIADDWNDRLESWCYVQDTPLAHQVGVTGYYVRISPSGQSGGRITLRNRHGETVAAAALVSMDFSYLVRLGLRDAHDPRVRDTLKIVDRILRVETPSGALYHRYNEDGYGEHRDGRAFDGSGIGRAWPLLVGERGHLAMQAGEDSLTYLQTMWKCASSGGLLPEQVWEGPPITSRGLLAGRPSGSAMPLLWSHAEFLKLLIAREQGRPIELLKCVEQRYGGSRVRRPSAWHWRTELPLVSVPKGLALRIEDRCPFSLHFGFDGWQRVQDRAARLQPFGLWSVDLTADELARCRKVDFTRHFADSWEGTNHGVLVDDVTAEHDLENARARGDGGTRRSAQAAVG
jgi:glucoamylase